MECRCDGRAYLPVICLEVCLAVFWSCCMVIWLVYITPKNGLGYKESFCFHATTTHAGLRACWLSWKVTFHEDQRGSQGADKCRLCQEFALMFLDVPVAMRGRVGYIMCGDQWEMKMPPMFKNRGKVLLKVLIYNFFTSSALSL